MQFLQTHHADVPLLKREAAVVTAVPLVKCSSTYNSYSACAFQHNDQRLASAATRGSLVCIEFAEDGTHSRWFGIIRFFCCFSFNPNFAPCVVAFVDYFKRWKVDVPSPVQRRPHPDTLTERVVLVKDIVGKVLLLPEESNQLWYVVDGVQNE